MGFEFEVINPGDENYDSVDSVLGESTERFDYNGFVEAYNGLKVGAIPHFKFNRERLSGFKKQMEDGYVGAAELSRWTVNRQYFMGKRGKRFLYWR